MHSYHKAGHYCFAQVGYVSEFCAMFSDECQQVSCDDMNKLNVGTLAVSRYHQLSRFFPVGDATNYPNHHFPYRNSKIIPSGYMLLQEQPSSRVEWFALGAQVLWYITTCQHDAVAAIPRLTDSYHLPPAASTETNLAVCTTEFQPLVLCTCSIGAPSFTVQTRLPMPALTLLPLYLS